MAELPKFARERLRQSGTEDMHPDANLLAAFTENALTARERSQVLEHLARCGTCRAVTGFALPESEARPAPVTTSEERRWARWTVLRWGTLAVSAVVIAIAVLVLRPQEKRATTPFPAMSETTIPSAPKPEPAPAEEKAKAADKAARQTKELAKVPALEDKAKERAKSTATKLQQPATEVRTQILNDSRAASNLANTANVANAQQQRRAGGPYVSGNQAQVASPQQNQKLLVPPPAPPVAKARADDASVPNANQALPVAGANETVDITAAALKDQKAETQQGFMAAAPTAPGTLARVRPVEGVAKKMEALRWTISPSGRISRSADGRSWAELPVGEGVGFRAISANGADIWAGGSGGALFHSSDGGERWTRVRPTFAGASLTTDITRIEFTDPQHGALVTTSGQKWTTSDGGKSWSID
jgi:hypothetical protein